MLTVYVMGYVIGIGACCIGIAIARVALDRAVKRVDCYRIGRCI
jgi:hypothetical protein